MFRRRYLTGPQEEALHGLLKRIGGVEEVKGILEYARGQLRNRGFALRHLFQGATESEKIVLFAVVQRQLRMDRTAIEQCLQPPVRSSSAVSPAEVPQQDQPSTLPSSPTVPSVDVVTDPLDTVPDPDVTEDQKVEPLRTEVSRTGKRKGKILSTLERHKAPLLSGSALLAFLGLAAGLKAHSSKIYDSEQSSREMEDEINFRNPSLYGPQFANVQDLNPEQLAVGTSIAEYCPDACIRFADNKVFISVGTDMQEADGDKAATDDPGRQPDQALPPDQRTVNGVLLGITRAQEEDVQKRFVIDKLTFNSAPDLVAAQDAQEQPLPDGTISINNLNIVVGSAGLAPYRQNGTKVRCKVFSLEYDGPLTQQHLREIVDVLSSTGASSVSPLSSVVIRAHGQEGIDLEAAKAQIKGTGFRGDVCFSVGDQGKARLELAKN
jgi:hypothetical protein